LRIVARTRYILNNEFHILNQIKNEFKIKRVRDEPQFCATSCRPDHSKQMGFIGGKLSLPREPVKATMA
jgi:hypothetical protein